MFSLWRREYLRFYLGVAALAILIASPWYVHIAAHLDWLGNPMAAQFGNSFGDRLQGVYSKLTWLLMLDMLLVLLVIRAWRMVPWFETRYRLILSMLVGFLPMLVECGLDIINPVQCTAAGMVFCTDHNVQPGTAPETILALREVIDNAV